MSGSDTRSLVVTRRGRGDGFWASIGGHVLDLADPRSSQGLAPTPDDLYVASLASQFAWSARTFLRASGLPDEVSVAAEWPAQDHLPTLQEVSLLVTVSRSAEQATESLVAAFADSLAARSSFKPVVHVSLEGVD